MNKTSATRVGQEIPKKQRLTKWCLGGLSLLLILTSLSSCSGLFFHPHKIRVIQPSDVGLSFSEVRIPYAEGEELYGWRLTAKGNLDPKGLILFLHGNGGNISTHLGSVAWLPSKGFEVVTLDYAGYGNSDGEASLTNVHRDAALLFSFFAAEARVRNIPFYVLGESLGGTVALYSAATLPTVDQPRCLIAVAPFSSYRKIAREKVGELWLFYPFQWPLGFLVRDSFSPIDRIKDLKVTTLLVHGRNDLTVPYHHSVLLQEGSAEGASLVQLYSHDEGHDGGHDGTLLNSEIQSEILRYLGSDRCKEISTLR